ncbi:MAG: PilT/PilU family type 4a pilus ATPase, partial [Myxococcales bacterium]|nr:PilT/PilU family type 4a pilus ATPase [Myxococcales bacterium]
VALDELFWMVASPDKQIRKVAAWFVKTRFNNQRSLRQLIQHFRQQDQLRAEILGPFLRVFAPEILLPHLNQLLDDGKAESQKLAAHVALALPYSEARELVVRLLSDPRGAVRLFVLQQLGLQDIEMPAELYEAVRAWLATPGGDRGEILQSIVASSFRNRLLVLTQLQIQGDDKLRHEIATLLRDLLDRGTLDLEREFVPLLSSADNEIRELAVKLLQTAPNRQAVVEAFIRASKRVLGWVRDRAFESLAELGQDIFDPINRLVRDGDPDVRLAALAAAAKLEEGKLTPALLERLGDPDRRVRILAIEILGRADDPRAVDLLLQLLGEPELLASVIGALGKRKDPRAIRAIVTHLNNPDAGIRLEVVNSLAAFDSIKLRPVLEKVIKIDPDTGVRQRAREALERLLRANNLDHHYVEELERNSLRLLGGERDTAKMEQLLLDVRKMGASDLHVRANAKPLARKFGTLYSLDQPSLSPADAEQMLCSLLTRAQLDRLERELQVDFCYTIRGVGRYRANVFVERHGYGGAFRVIPAELPSFETIGLPQKLLDVLQMHQGLVIVSGSAGSGKTTTLAALVNLINEQRAYHVLTLEDPIEFLHPFKQSLVNQREVHTHSRSFARALRAGLREDPDVIVVGELRDRDTISLAVTAAETGHVVIGTIHATTAAKTIDRLIDAYPPSEQPLIRTLLAESLKVVLNQRLVPRKDGLGRIACFELLVPTSAISSHIRDGRTFMIPSTMQISQQAGVITLDMALERLVKAGTVSGEEAYLRAEKRETFERYCASEFLEGVGQTR